MSTPSSTSVPLSLLVHAVQLGLMSPPARRHTCVRVWHFHDNINVKPIPLWALFRWFAFHLHDLQATSGIWLWQWRINCHDPVCCTPTPPPTPISFPFSTSRPLSPLIYLLCNFSTFPISFFPLPLWWELHFRFLRCTSFLLSSPFLLFVNIFHRTYDSKSFIPF